MKIQISIILLCSLIVAEAAISITRLEPCPGHPGRCYSPGPPEINMEVGEIKQVSGKCESIMCEKGSDGFLVTFTSCGVAHDTIGCELSEDLSKPYPDCCPQLKC